MVLFVQFDLDLKYSDFFFYLKGLMKLFKSYISLLFACSLSNGVEVTQLSDLGMWIGVYF